MKAFIFYSDLKSNNNLPTALLKLENGETILGRQLRLLRNVNIKSVIISGGYYGKEIEKYCTENFSDFNFVFSHYSLYDEDNTIHSLIISSHMRHTDFIVIHGNIVFDENILTKLINDPHPNLACINSESKKEEAGLKGRVIRGKLEKISTDIFTIDDYALRPLFKVSSELFREWMKEIKKMINLGYSDIYSLNPLSNILPSYDVKTIDYRKHFIEVVRNDQDYHDVEEWLRSYTFDNQELYTGNYINKLIEIFNKKQYKRPFVVYKNTKEEDHRFNKFLEEYNCTTFTNFSKYPQYAEIIEGLELFKKNSYDVIIAIGDGGTLNVAKAIKAFSGLNDKVPYFEQEIEFVDLSLICIPTTAGSGGEATRFASLYFEDKRITFEHDSLFPNIVVHDAALLDDFSKYQRSVMMLEAFYKAIEGFWSKNANEKSREYSEKAITLFNEAYKFHNADYRFINPYIMKASYFAGQSINIAGTTALEAMSAALSRIKDIEYGQTLGLIMPSFYNCLLEQVEGNKLVADTLRKLTIILKTTKKEIGNGFKQLFKTFELETLAVSEQKLENLIKCVEKDKNIQNPIVLSHEKIGKIYRESLLVK